jgi:hypothetical protein
MVGALPSFLLGPRLLFSTQATSVEQGTSPREPLADTNVTDVTLRTLALSLFSLLHRRYSLMGFAARSNFDRRWGIVSRLH